MNVNADTALALKESHTLAQQDACEATREVLRQARRRRFPSKPAAYTRSTQAGQNAVANLLGR